MPVPIPWSARACAAVRTTDRVRSSGVDYSGGPGDVELFGVPFHAQPGESPSAYVCRTVLFVTITESMYIIAPCGACVSSHPRSQYIKLVPVGATKVCDTSDHWFAATAFGTPGKYGRRTRYTFGWDVNTQAEHVMLSPSSTATPLDRFT